MTNHTQLPVTYQEGHDPRAMHHCAPSSELGGDMVTLLDV